MPRIWAASRFVANQGCPGVYPFKGTVSTSVRSRPHWRFHAFFTTTDPAVLDTVTADKTHRRHAIEQVHADLKNSALAHLPSGVFTANAGWLVLAVIAFNLTRAAGTLATPAQRSWPGRPRRPC